MSASIRKLSKTLNLFAQLSHHFFFNVTRLQSLVDACNNNGISCGVYSSASQWSAIFGSLGYSYGANFPLW